MDIHAGNSSEMECLEGHLSPRLSDALSSHGTDSCPRFDACTHELVHTRGEELLQLSSSDPLDLVENCGQWKRIGTQYKKVHAGAYTVLSQLEKRH